MISPHPSQASKSSTVFKLIPAFVFGMTGFFGWMPCSAIARTIPQDSHPANSTAEEPRARDGRKPRFRYQFDQEKPLIYKFNSTIKVDKSEVINQGTIEYDFLKQDAAKFIEGLSKKEQEYLAMGGNGTGWVVHPDGWIVTCAHVVDGIEVIEVTLNEKNYIGEVVAVEEKTDLALVKIKGDDHRFLSLRSDLPKLGASARIFGFPLAKQLGSSMKMTSGSVTGRDKVGEKGFRLQLDATANPGNSGGPVTDDQGRVIGVADSILASSELSNMSFAVPTRDLVKLLNSRKVEFRNNESKAESKSRLSEKQARLEVTQLEDVSDAVALLEINPTRNMKNWKVVRFSIRSSSQTAMRGGDPFAQMRAALSGVSIPQSQNLNGHLILDETGKMIYASEHHFLAGPMQDQATIGLFPLSGNDQDEWRHRESMVLISEKTPSDESPFGRLGMPSHFGRFGFRDQSETVQREITRCKIEENYSAPGDGDRIELKRTVKTERAEREDTEDLKEEEFSLAGSLHFDRNSGCFAKGNLSGRRDVSLEGHRLQIESDFSFARVSAEQLEKERAELKARAAEVMSHRGMGQLEIEKQMEEQMRKHKEALKKHREEFFKNMPQQFRNDPENQKFFGDPPGEEEPETRNENDNDKDKQNERNSGGNNREMSRSGSSLSGL